MNESGLAIQWINCKIAGDFGPSGSDMTVSYYKAAIVTQSLNRTICEGIPRALPKEWRREHRVLSFGAYRILDDPHQGCLIRRCTRRQPQGNAGKTLISELSKEGGKIAEKMKNRWSDVVLDPLYSVVGSSIAMGTTLFVDPTGTLAITGAGASLISTVYRAYRSNQDYTDALSKPMACAAEFKMRN